MTNGRVGANGQTPTGMIRPESLELNHAQGVYDSSSGYGSMSSNMSHARVVAPPADYHQASAQRYPTSSNYGVLSRNQLQGGCGRDYAGGASASLTNSSYSGAGSTPTLQDPNQMSPQSISSSDSSGQSRGGSRPAQPPPAPPPPMPTGGVPPQSVRPAPPLPAETRTNGDVRQQFAHMQIDSNSSAAEILRYSRTVSPMRSQPTAFSISQSSSHERSVSPDLPPPPPPLYSENYTIVDVGRESTPSKGNGYSAPPPPPPPPTTSFNGFSPDKQRETSVPTSGSFQSSNDQRSNVKSSATKQVDGRIDARSDLLRAIRDGFQLKKVDRKEEKEREEDAATKGHDVAAILKRRMEDVMGRGSESEESASDFDDDWDD